MAVVSVAITVSFHLSHKPSEIELRMARPLGSIFWALSVATLVIGVGNYISASCSSLPVPPLSISCIVRGQSPLTNVRKETVNQYSRKAAIVQSGWRTQTVSPCRRSRYEASSLTAWQVLGFIAASIVGTCIIFLVIANL